MAGVIGAREHRERTRGVWVAYGAALWAAVFAVFHIVWAAGWYPLLDAEGARAGMGTTLWKWTFDVVVAGMCVIAVPVALAPVTAWGQRLPRGIVYRLALIGSSLLLLRFTASLAQTVYFVAAGRFRFGMIGIWDWWFVLGTALFVATTWQSRQRGSGF